jgi:hypothetical protein
VSQGKFWLWKPHTSVHSAETASKTEKTCICTQKNITTKKPKPKASGYSLSDKQANGYL